MVGRHEYEVDMPAGELRFVKDKSKTLELFKMETEGDKLSFWYNHETQRISEEPSPRDQQNIQRVSFPFMALDPSFHNRIEAETKEAEELINSGKSIHLNPGGIHAPVENDSNGPKLLPMINLYGTDFFIDLRLKELRQTDNPTNVIAYKHLIPHEFHFMLWYNTSTKNAFTGTLEQAKQRSDVKALVLPPLDLMIRDGVKRHEEKLALHSRKVESRTDMESSKRKRKRGRGL